MVDHFDVEPSVPRPDSPYLDEAGLPCSDRDGWTVDPVRDAVDTSWAEDNTESQRRWGGFHVVELEGELRRDLLV
jgi:hypothetical protein